MQDVTPIIAASTPGRSLVEAAQRSRAAASVGYVPTQAEQPRLTLSTLMLLAISATGKHLYQGTVPAHVKAARRAHSKRARAARRVHRK